MIRAIPLLPLWVFVACSWLTFTFTREGVAVRQPPPPTLGAPLTRKNPKDHFHVPNLATTQILGITTESPEGQQIQFFYFQ
jgi:hypothetical protein